MSENDYRESAERHWLEFRGLDMRHQAKVFGTSSRYEFGDSNAYHSRNIGGEEFRERKSR